MADAGPCSMASAPPRARHRKTSRARLSKTALTSADTQRIGEQRPEVRDPACFVIPVRGRRADLCANTRYKLGEITNFPNGLNPNTVHSRRRAQTVPLTLLERTDDDWIFYEDPTRLLRRRLDRLDERDLLRWIVEHDGNDLRADAHSNLIESTTGDGGRDAGVNRILGVLERAAQVLQSRDEATACRAGRLRYLAKSDDGIDALVAAAAVGDGSPAVLLTSDPDDLARVLQHDPHVNVRTV